MNARLLKKIIRQIGEQERILKRIESAELNLSVQKDIEAERKRKRELETAWILGLTKEMPQ